MIWLFWPPKPSPSLFFLFNHIFSLCIFQLLSQTLILALPIHITYAYIPQFASGIFLTLIFLYRHSRIHFSLNLALTICLFRVWFAVRCVWLLPEILWNINLLRWRKVNWISRRISSVRSRPINLGFRKVIFDFFEFLSTSDCIDLLALFGFDYIMCESVLCFGSVFAM